MTRKHLLDLGPSLIVGVGIVVSTFIAARAAGFGWLVLAGPGLLALALVGAGMLEFRLRGASPGRSRAALILAGSFLLAGAIVTPSDPNLVKTLIPICGVAGWVTLLARSEDRRKTCRDR